jgi:hypothetical protein
VLRGRRLQGDAHQQKSYDESVMKCSNPDCARGIGLVAYRRGWFSKRRYCSRSCRDAFVADRPRQSQPEQIAATYFEWLFLQSTGTPQQKLMPAANRTKAR